MAGEQGQLRPAKIGQVYTNVPRGNGLESKPIPKLGIKHYSLYILKSE